MVETDIEGEKERRAERREGGWRGHCRSGGKDSWAHVLAGLLSSLLLGEPSCLGQCGKCPHLLQTPSIHRVQEPQPALPPPLPVGSGGMLGWRVPPPWLLVLLNWSPLGTSARCHSSRSYFPLAH